MTAANLFVSQLYHLAESKGVDTGDLLRRADIRREVIDSPDTRVATEKLAVIVESIWDHLQDESMGLSGHRIPRGAFHMMGKLAIHEANLEDALTIGVRFYGMTTDAYRMVLEVEGSVATLKFYMSHPEMDPQHLFAESNLMAWHRFASWLISENVALNEVYFDYPKPDHVAEYAYLFPGQHIFSASFQGFSFDSRFLRREIKQSAASLKAFVKRGPMEFFIQPKTDFNVSSDLQRLLKKNLSEGFPRIEDAADSLHMTKRTLIRKLKEEGTSYQQLKDLVRRDRAIYLLTCRTMPLSEIATAVGLSDSAVFARAFKTWTGVSPREYRASK